MAARGTLMQAVVDLVTSHPGIRAKDVAVEIIRENQNIKVGYSAIERCIKRRLVRGHRPTGAGPKGAYSGPLFLYLWDEKLVVAADAAERFAYERGQNLPSADRAARMQVAADAWLEAGDEARARYLNIVAKNLEDGHPYVLSIFPDHIPVTVV